ncbi:MAG TPA: hypothetical protein VF731_14615 [Solirubrobacterales bacterium]
MPLEGHYQRVNTPLRKLTPREKWVVSVGLLVTVAALLALLFVPSTTKHPYIQSRSGCIEVAVAGRVGSEPVIGCGGKAVALCRRAAEFTGVRAETIVSACDEQGIKY